MKTVPSMAKKGDLPAIMQEWKACISDGAAAAIEVYESLPSVLYGDGQLERNLYGLTRANVLAIDPSLLEAYRDDLRDLRVQADYAMEAMESVIAIVSMHSED
jgi:hypothetical protein